MLNILHLSEVVPPTALLLFFVVLVSPYCTLQALIARYCCHDISANSARCALTWMRVVPGQASGIYLSRSLSYEGAEFSIINVDIDPVFKVRTTTLCMLAIVCLW